MSFEPSAARELVGLAEHLAMAGDLYAWPDIEPRDETLVLLDVSDARTLTAEVAPLGLADALAFATGWLDTRPEGERAPRERLLPRPAVG